MQVSSRNIIIGIAVTLICAFWCFQHTKTPQIVERRGTVTTIIHQQIPKKEKSHLSTAGAKTHRADNHADQDSQKSAAAKVAELEDLNNKASQIHVIAEAARENGLTRDQALTLMGFLQDPSLRVRNVALIWMRYARTDEVRDLLRPFVTEMLTDEAINVRSAAIETLGYVGDESSKQELQRFLDDPDQITVKWTKRAIAEISKRINNP